MISRALKGLLVSSVLLLGCGSSSSGGGNGAAFVGTWTYISGSTLTPSSCMVLGTTIPPLDLTGDTVTITAGASASEIDFVEGTACTIKFTVSGTTATATSDQSCTLPVSGISAVLNVTSWTLTLSGDTLMAGFSGSAPIGGTSCTASGTGTLAKNTPDAATTDAKTSD
ncbi:MAG TPA: hypothetical protein VFG23_14970 [Polyangia bacterium]|nr:hypothetical protein [Polyangia bacterium]